MSKVVINFKVDKEVKEEAQRLARDLGVPLSTLVNAQIKQMLRSRTVTLATDLKPSPYLEGLIKKAEADYAAGRNITRVTSEAELEAYLASL